VVKVYSDVSAERAAYVVRVNLVQVDAEVIRIKDCLLCRKVGGNFGQGYGRGGDGTGLAPSVGSDCIGIIIMVTHMLSTCIICYIKKIPLHAWTGP
jgi:hypothetical protein